MAEGSAESRRRLQDAVRSVKDFPVPGILFRDITPIFRDAEVLRCAIEEMAALAPPEFDSVASIEARGFLLGLPLALRLGKSFVPIRKPGKLPAAVEQIEYGLEYGKDRLEVHIDACDAGDKVWLIDDVLATGGSLDGAAKLIERIGGEVVAMAVLIELEGLDGQEALGGKPCDAVLKLSASGE